MNTHILRKIAADRSNVTLGGKGSMEPVNPPQPDEQYTPEQVYKLEFGNNRQVANREYNKSQQFRRKRLYQLADQVERNGGKVTTLPGDQYLPVIPYPVHMPYTFNIDKLPASAAIAADQRNNFYRHSKHRLWPAYTGKSVFYNTIVPGQGPANIPAQPAIMHMFRDYKQPISNPIVQPGDNNTYSSVSYSNPEGARSFMKVMLNNPKLPEAKRREAQSLINLEPGVYKRHELNNHGATPPLDARGYQYFTGVGLPSKNAKNTRGWYGLGVGEGLGGMHAVKGAFGKKHPDIELSNDFFEAVEQLKAAGYIDADGLINNKLFDGTGYTVDAATINSIMEALQLYDTNQLNNNRQLFRNQLRWYWPQASNNTVKNNPWDTRALVS